MSPRRLASPLQVVVDGLAVDVEFGSDLLEGETCLVVRHNDVHLLTGQLGTASGAAGSQLRLAVQAPASPVLEHRTVGLTNACFWGSSHLSV